MNTITCCYMSVLTYVSAGWAICIRILTIDSICRFGKGKETEFMQIQIVQWTVSLACLVNDTLITLIIGKYYSQLFNINSLSTEMPRGYKSSSTKLPRSVKHMQSYVLRKKIMVAAMATILAVYHHQNNRNRQDPCTNISNNMYIKFWILIY